MTKINIYAEEGYPLYGVEFWDGNEETEWIYTSNISSSQYKFIEKAFHDFKKAQELLAKLNEEPNQTIDYLELPPMIVGIEQ